MFKLINLLCLYFKNTCISVIIMCNYTLKPVLTLSVPTYINTIDTYRVVKVCVWGLIKYICVVLYVCCLNWTDNESIVLCCWIELVSWLMNFTLNNNTIVLHIRVWDCLVFGVFITDSVALKPSVLYIYCQILKFNQFDQSEFYIYSKKTSTKAIFIV